MKKLLFIPILILLINNVLSQTILFSEDFDDEVITDMSGTSTEGIAWTSNCPFCLAGDIYEVNTFGSIVQGLKGNDTNGPATFVANGIDATGMYVIILEFDYESDPWVGSGSNNLECSSECSGCSGDPADIMTSACQTCWDFLHWEISTGTFSDGGIVVGNDCSIASSGHVISNPGCASPYDGNGVLIPGNDPSNLTLTITMAMWASDEEMIIDNVVITGYTKAEAIAAGLMSEAGDDNTVDLCIGTGTHDLFNDILGSPDNGGIWNGPASTSNGDQGTIDLSTLATGDYSYITSTGAGCQDTAVITVTSIGTTPTASVSGVADICQGDIVTITGSGTGGAFEWSDGSSGSTLDISIADDYWFAIIGGCDSDTAFFTIGDLGAAPTASVSGVADICSGSTVTITGSGSGTFEWSDASTNPTLDINTAGNYYLAVENVCGFDTAFFTINDLGGAPTAGVTGVQNICQGDVITVSGTGIGNYSWSNASTGPTLNISSAGNYYLAVSNVCGSDTAFFNVGDLGAPPVGNLTGNSFVCSPTATTILTASGGTTYTWSTGSNNSSETFSGGDIGYVLVFNQCGQDSIPFTITDETVVASFALSDSTGEEPLSIQSTNNSTNANDYAWTFGDGNSSSSVSPSIVYTTNGSYIVTLVASNTFCSDSTSVTVIVYDPAPLVIPNICTPNNDGTNDLFKVVHYSVNEFTGSIYNRWGQKLFENTDQYVFQWDGYNESGKPAPSGTYYYILEATFINGETEKFSGAFELIR